MKVAVSGLLFALWVCRFSTTRAHGMMTKPMSHNVYFGKGPKIPSSTDLGGAGNVQNLNAAIGGGPDGMHKEATVGHSLCGDIPTRGAFMPGTGKYGNAPSACTYKAGSEVIFEVDITAYHQGWFEFRLCDVEKNDGKLTQECLNKHVLSFNPNDSLNKDHANYATLSKNVKCDGIPGAPKGSCCNGGGICNNFNRWVLGAQIPTYRMKFKLPEGFECEKCVLQWFYQTGKPTFNSGFDF